MNSTVWTVQKSRTLGLARAVDYIELTKPKIAVLVLTTVAVAGVVASVGQVDWATLLHALIGTALVASSASAINQWMERHTDALMERTVDRPLPAGRLSSVEVLTFGVVTIALGIVYLMLTVGWLTALLGAVTWLLYTMVYTPLKSRTSWNTAVGAVGGAMPVAMGWAAVGGEWGVRPAILLLIVFLWQFPHFMAIAWLYRHQYAKAGLKMLTVVDPSGRRAGIQAVVMALVLLLVSLAPGLTTPTAGVYLAAAFLLGVGQLICSVLFLVHKDETSARRLLRASLVYLPALLVLLILFPLA